MRFIASAILLLTLTGCSGMALTREFTSANLDDWQHCRDRAVGYIDPVTGLAVPGFLTGAHALTREAHLEFLNSAIGRAKAADDNVAKQGK